VIFAPVPARSVRMPTPLSVVTGRKALVPHQAKAAASAASRRRTIQSFATEPFLMGCSGTAVTDILYPQKSEGRRYIAAPSSGNGRPQKEGRPRF
jgi:hypothetical protein